MNESSDTKLVYELKSNLIRLTSPNDKSIILLCFIDENIRLYE